MIETIYFDLGNTLVRYYDLSDFSAILRSDIACAANALEKLENCVELDDLLWARVQEENFEAKELSVRPLEERLQRIFQLRVSGETIMNACRAFMEPIFALGYVYADTLPVLQEVRARGIKMAIISNTPWGSPATLWSEELEWLGIAPLVDGVFWCRDCGYRKPAKQAMIYALDALKARPERALMVGDDPRWDIVGAKTVGMDALLLDRAKRLTRADAPIIHSLHDLLDHRLLKQ